MRRAASWGGLCEPQKKAPVANASGATGPGEQDICRISSGPWPNKGKM